MLHYQYFFDITRLRMFRISMSLSTLTLSSIHWGEGQLCRLRRRLWKSLTQSTEHSIAVVVMKDIWGQILETLKNRTKNARQVQFLAKVQFLDKQLLYSHKTITVALVSHSSLVRKCRHNYKCTLQSPIQQYHDSGNWAAEAIRPSKTKCIYQQTQVWL